MFEKSTTQSTAKKIPKIHYIKDVLQMSWNLDSSRPIYAQIIEKVSLNIVSGKYQPGDKLPSVRDLAAQAGVSPNTMQKALSELERENLVHSVRTSGRFVHGKP